MQSVFKSGGDSDTKRDHKPDAVPQSNSNALEDTNCQSNANCEYHSDAHTECEPDAGTECESISQRVVVAESERKPERHAISFRKWDGLTVAVQISQHYVECNSVSQPVYNTQLITELKPIAEPQSLAKLKPNAKRKSHANAEPVAKSQCFPDPQPKSDL